MICAYNGDFIDETKLYLSPHNRAFKYGDAVFESLRVIRGKVAHLPRHCVRLLGGIELLQFEAPFYFNLNYISGQIRNLLIMNKITGDARLRLTVFRDGAGTYTPQTNEISYLITCENLPTKGYELNAKGLLLGTYSDYLRGVTPFSMFKNGNALYYVLAGLYAKKNNFDECVLLNENRRIAECVSSNIFVIKDKKIYTPPCAEGAVRGVMRSVIIDICNENQLDFEEKTLTTDDLLASDEVFLTNATVGIKWVMGYENKRFFKRQTLNIHNLLNEYARN